jgi:uncharacterized membrane protein YgcG
MDILTVVPSARKAVEYRSAARTLLLRTLGVCWVPPDRPWRPGLDAGSLADITQTHVAYQRPRAGEPRLLLYLHLAVDGHKLCVAFPEDEQQQQVWYLPVLARRALFQDPTIVTGYLLRNAHGVPKFFVDYAPVVCGACAHTTLSTVDAIAAMLASTVGMGPLPPGVAEFDVCDHRPVRVDDPRPNLVIRRNAPDRAPAAPIAVVCLPPQPAVACPPDDVEEYDPAAAMAPCATTMAPCATTMAPCATTAPHNIAPVQHTEFDARRNANVHPSRLQQYGGARQQARQEEQAGRGGGRAVRTRFDGGGRSSAGDGWRRPGDQAQEGGPQEGAAGSRAGRGDGR